MAGRFPLPQPTPVERRKHSDRKTAESLGLTGEETYDIVGFKEQLDQKFTNGRTVSVAATDPGGKKKTFRSQNRRVARIDRRRDLRHRGLQGAARPEIHQWPDGFRCRNRPRWKEENIQIAKPPSRSD